MPATATVTSARLSLGEVDRHIAARPRRLRRELGLTQQRLASLVGISVRQAHEYETRAGLLPADWLAAVAAALGVGVEYFFGGLGRDEAPEPGPGRRQALELAREDIELRGGRLHLPRGSSRGPGSPLSGVQPHAGRRPHPGVLLWLAVGTAAAGTAAPASAATTYVVDQRNPRCADAGRGSAAAPFCTIGAGAARALAGDTVGVRAGTYAEQVTVTRSGTAATARITFLAKPGATLTGRASGFALLGVRWVTVRGFAVVGTASHGVQVTGSSHVTLAHNRVRGSGGSGIYVADSSDVLLAGNGVARSTDYGIELVRDQRFTVRDGEVKRSGRPAEGATRKGVYVSACQGGLITRAVVDRNSDSGIYLTGGTTGVRVEGNVARGNARGYIRAAVGIELRDATGDVVAGNRSYGNEDSGIQLSAGAADDLVVNNIVFGNGDHGIHALDAARARIVGNSVYRNATTGINVEGGSTGAVIENNVSVDNGLTHPATQGDVRVDGAASAGVVVDYNLVYLTSPGVLYAWGSKQYGSQAALRAAVPGVEAHGLQADPRWVAPGSGNFSLRAGSPAIDSADSGASGASTFDAQQHRRFDDPGTPNTGAGPRTFDDRGALEFR